MTEPSPNSDKATPAQEKMSRVSDDPGVYMMKDAAGKIIYIGKARNLKKRLAAYFKNSGHLDIKTGILVKKIVDFETVITRTEKEALILEANLIKRYKPRYNVILKDDKRYPSLRLDLKEDYPSFTIARKIGLDDALYFGPFASAYAVRETLKMINRTFMLRKCKAKDFKTRTRPCLHCQMEGCLAPCCLDVDPDVYRENINEAIVFLNGRTHDLIRKTKKQMQQAAADQDFEKAARLRDKMFSLEKTVEKHVAVITDFKDRDVFALAGNNDFWLVTLFIVRGGFLRGTRHFDFSEIMASDQEIMGAFIRQYYEKNHFVPAEILVSSALEDRQLIEEFLTGLKKMKVRILHPQKGKKAELVKMAVNNAEKELHDLMASRTAEMDVLNRLQKRLKMNRLPRRVECFDNSNISGSSPVAGMVVFEKGKPLKSAYRKYRIKTVSEHDDYAYMSEVLQRRLGKGEASKPYPDLLMVDGGKGQLNIAVSVVKGLNLLEKFEIIGIAKKDEKKGEIYDKVFKPGRVNPISFGREGDLLLFLQRIRDEAHRFAITFHRQRRQKSSLQSMLDTIPGIGKKRKATLFRHFKSLKAIRAASLEEISALPGIGLRLAEEIQRSLNK
ncbi:MAG: excinuclease ABC subunit UvrC [Deltaproteobacteria bacterium]|jgi:excinuclease ABC subunit C|nr:excinuclease ABC subunit UvrC [Deltaproteobacteria bacterium]